MTSTINARALLLAMFDAAVQRALPAHNTAAFLPAPPDPKKGRTLVLGAGKAGGAMAAAVDALWPADAPISGLVVTRYGHVPPAYKTHPGRIEVVEAAHPVPEPETYALMLAGLGLIGAMSRRAVPKANTAVRSTQAA